MPPFTTLDLCSIDFGDDESHHDFSLEHYGTHWSTTEDACNFMGEPGDPAPDEDMNETGTPAKTRRDSMKTFDPVGHAERTKRRHLNDHETQAEEDDRKSRESTPGPEMDRGHTHTASGPRTPPMQMPDQPSLHKNKVVVDGVHYMKAKTGRLHGGTPQYGRWFYGAVKKFQSHDQSDPSLPVARIVYIEDFTPPSTHKHKKGNGTEVASDAQHLVRILNNAFNNGSNTGHGKKDRGGKKNPPNLHKMALKVALYGSSYSTIVSQLITTMDLQTVRDRTYDRPEATAITCMRYLIRHIRALGKGNFVVMGGPPTFAAAAKALERKNKGLPPTEYAAAMKEAQHSHIDKIKIILPDTDATCTRLLVSLDNEALGYISIRCETVEDKLRPPKPTTADGKGGGPHLKKRTVISTSSIADAMQQAAVQRPPQGQHYNHDAAAGGTHPSSLVVRH